MFDTVLGLPVHVLVVHAVVVLLPLMALVTIAVAFLPGLRALGGWIAWAVAAVDLVMVLTTLVARQSGEALQARLGGQVAQAHGDLGRNLVWFTVALFVAAVLVAVFGTVDRRSARPSGRPASAGAAALALVTGVAAIWWTVRVGHTGAEAVWSGIVESTNHR